MEDSDPEALEGIYEVYKAWTEDVTRLEYAINRLV